MDTIEIIGLILFLVIWTGYSLIAILQYGQSNSSTQKLVSLNVRTAFFLPAYSLMHFIAIFNPTALAGLHIFITFMEGYSFYCFYTMIIFNLGGPVKAIEAFNKSGRDLICCRLCCPSDGLVFYKRTIWALFHFIFTRTILSIASALATLARNERVERALSAIFSLVAVVILFLALMHILLFYERVFESSNNLYGVVKAFLLKFSVGLIVIQGLVVQFMAVTGSQPYNDDDNWTANQKTIRGYAVLVLIEYTVLSPIYLYAFGIYKITNHPDSPATLSDKSTASEAGKSSGSDSSFCFFLYDVVNVFDHVGYLLYRESDENAYSKVVTTESSAKVIAPPPSDDHHHHNHAPNHDGHEEADGDSHLELEAAEEHRAGQLVSDSKV